MNRTIAALILAYPHQDWPKASQELYKEMLKDTDPDLLLAGAQHYITTNTKSNFIPGIAELRHAVVDVQMMNSGMPIGIIAWGEVQKSLSGGHGSGTICEEGMQFANAASGKTGEEHLDIINDWNLHREKCDLCVDSHDKKYEYSHPAIARVVDAMGIRYLRESDNHVADRAHFLKAYEQVVTRETKEIVTLPQIKELAKQKQIDKGE